MPKSIIEFEDNFQDFLRWIVDENGVVTRSWPYQTDIWKGLKVTNLAKLKAGREVTYSFQGRTGTIKHLVKSVIPLASAEITVRTDSFGYITSSVRGKKASCTHGAEYAVQRLAKKLFPDHTSTIERLECTAVGRLHSKWRITPEGV